MAAILMGLLPGLLLLQALPAAANASAATTAAVVQLVPETPKQAFGSAKSLPTLTSSDETQTDADSGIPKSEFKAPKGALPEEERTGLVRQPAEAVDNSSPTVAALLAEPPCGSYQPWQRGVYVAFGTYVASDRRVWFANQNIPASLNIYAPHVEPTGWLLVGPCPVPPAPSTVSMTPANGALVLTEQPTLQVQGSTWSGGSIDFEFFLCETSTLLECVTYETCCSLSANWQIPAGSLTWGKQYWWRVKMTDASTIGGAYSYSMAHTFTVGVRQPTITSQLSTPGINGQEFHQQAGNYTTSVTDVQVPVVGPPLSVLRSYNSMDTRRTGVFGAGWSTRWDMRIVPETIRGREALLVTYPDGRQVRFADKKNGTFQPPPGMYATLATVSGGGWRLMDKSSTSYLFDAQGRLAKITDNRGRSQDLTYGTDGKLGKATAVGGRSLMFGWTGSHITTVTTDPVDGKALTWNYSYVGDVLTQVCNPAQECTTYDHDPGSQYRSTVLDSDPYAYWRLGDATGNAKDLGWGGTGDATYGATAKRAQPGALAGTPDGAVELTPTTGVRPPEGIVPRLGKYATMEAWFKTSSSGTVMSLRTYTDAPKEEVFGIGTDGKLRSSYQPTSTPITTAAPVNDGAWHHAVLTVADNLQTLYLDGAVVGTLSQTITGTEYRYITTVGGLAGLVDEVAIYDRPLHAYEVQRHYTARGAAPHKLTKITLPSGRVWAANVHEPTTDRLKSHTDQHGGTWQIGDETINRNTGTSTVEVTDPNGGKITTVYDSWRGYRLISSTDQVQNAKTQGEVKKPTTYSYDTGGYLSKVTDPNGNSAEYTHDKRGNTLTQRTCRQSGNCQTVRADYYVNSSDQFDARNDRVVKVRDARSASATDNTYATSYEYNSFGEQTKQTSPATLDFPNGRSTTVAYTDGTETAVGGGTTPAGLAETGTDAKGNVTELRYTAAGDLAEQTEPSGLVTRQEHDVLGRVTGQTQISDAHPNGVKTALTYDGGGRLVAQTAPGVQNKITDVTHTAETSYTYDPDGNTLTATIKDLTGGDSARTTAYTYDAFGHQETLTDPEGGVVRTTWNKLGLQDTVTNQVGAVFGYTYTKRGELATKTLKNWTGSPVNPQPPAEITLEQRSYDDGGRLAAQVDAMLRKTSYKYFNDNLLSQVIGEDLKLNGATTTKAIALEINTYDAAGHLTKRVTGADPISGVGITTTEYVYDAASRLTSTALDPNGLNRKTVYAYDANGALTKETRTGTGSSRQEIASYTYNAAGVRTGQTIENGDQDLTTTWTVDDRGLITAVTDPRGNAAGATAADYTTTNTYDALGRLIETKAPSVQVDKAGAQPATIRPTTQAGYDTFGNQTYTVEAEGRTVATAYDKAGRAVKLTMPSYTAPGGTAVTPSISHGYDAAGRRISTTDQRGYTTTIDYDALGNPVRQTDPGASGQGGVWIAEYDRVGEQLSSVDPNGARTEATYDDLGRKITETVIERKPTTAAHTTRFTYNNAGMLLSTVDPRGKTTSYVPNAAGEVTSFTDPAQNMAKSTYDLAGRPVRVTDATNSATETSYDLAGRPIEVKDLNAAGTTLRSATFGYDLASNPISQTSAEQHTTKQSFDALNRPVTLTEPVSASEEIVTRFGYDANGSRTKLTDGRGNITWTTYNSLGLVERVIEPVTSQHPNEADRTWTYGYDQAGNNTSVLQPGGVQITRAFDHLGRLTQEDGSGGGAATAQRTFGYDSAGQLTTAGDYTLEYNDRGLLTKLAQPTGQPTTMAYDESGNLIQRVDAAGTAAFTWDDANRVKTASDPVTGRTWTYGYDKANRVESLTSANPANTQVFGYDDMGRATSQILKSSTGTELAKITYGWDLDDNLTTKTTTGLAGAGTNTYTYDHANRLTSWTAPGGTTTAYEWDASGNRTKAGDKTFTYDERNRLLEGDGTDYTYTPRGTLATSTKAGATTNHTFDAFDRLIADGDSLYAYDVFNRVTSRITGTTKQAHLYAGLSNDLAAISVSGSIQAKYSHDPSGALLGLQEGTAAATAAMSDLHGDLVATYTGTALNSSTSYDPFGETAAQTGDETNLGYQGEYTDPDSGKVNMHARWYQPGTGTFTSRDTAALAPSPSVQANRYTYANASPLTGTDPTGHYTVIGSGAIAGLGNSYTSGMGFQTAASIYSPSTTASWAGNTGASICIGSCSRSEGSGAVACDIQSCGGVSFGHLNVMTIAEMKLQNVLPNGMTPPDGLWESGRNKYTYFIDQIYAMGLSEQQAEEMWKWLKDPNFKVSSDGTLVGPESWTCPSGTSSKQCEALKKAAKEVAEAEAFYDRCLGKGGSLDPNVTKWCADFAERNDIDPLEFQYLQEQRQKELDKKRAEKQWFYDLLEGITDFFWGDVVSCHQKGGMACLMMIVSVVAGGAVKGVKQLAKWFPRAAKALDGAATACRRNSFATGTLVLMADGSRKPIEEVRVGDEVLATDPTTGETAAKEVTALIDSSGMKQLVEITTRAERQGRIEKHAVIATAQHPFWVPALGRWVDATYLQPSTWLRTSTGTWIQIANVRRWTAPQQVYNLTVADIHTYYAGSGAVDILVHNDDCIEALAKTIDTSNLKYTDTVAGHSASRGYTKNRTLIEHIIETGRAMPDPQGVPGAVAWKVEGTYNGKQGIFELVIDARTNTVMHFLFKSNRR
ncbi:polymorphic toxin-type HINT domain-containing protein [Nonomuraea sp. PA05]|uniref:polymorphic toxin-type HINT domain-containing protein n=1 Tax=Nonomuraea sp. PA05 TaxID=2604466 RepID=UPI001652529F|nr:polymorphic toxin-type HINT domain-containing protein [Nonomuraea sp. PA05]